MLLLIVMFLGCGSETSDTLDVPEEDGGTSAGDFEGLPVLSVENPARGSFDTSGSGAVRGAVNTAGSSADEITVNGQAYALTQAGRFEADMGWEPGIQILSTRVESSNGERAVDGRAFHAGPVNQPGEWIEGALRMEIDHEILDDDDADPDDIAGLLELALEDESLVESLIGVPVDLGPAVFTPSAVSYGRARIDLAPHDGALNAVISLDGIDVDFDIAGVDWYSWLATSGSAWATSVDMGMALTVASAGGEVRAEATDVDVVINGFGMTVEWVPDILEADIAGWVEDFMVEAITQVAVEEIPPEVENVLSGFAVGTTFDVDLALDMRLAEIEVVPEGVRFEVDAKIEATESIELPPGAGSLETAGDAPDWPEIKDQPFWAAVDDDLINQLGFAFWQTGLVKDIELDAVLLGALSGGPLPAPLGPADTVQMTLQLPPVLSPAEESGWAAQLAVGEWEIIFNRTDGEQLKFSVSFQSHVQAAVDEDGAIALSVDARPAKIQQAVGVLDAPDALDPGDLSALIRLLVPPLLGNAASFAPDIPIPEIPLDEFVSLPSTEGRVIRVADPSVEVEDDGWMLIQADIEVH